MRAFDSEEFEADEDLRRGDVLCSELLFDEEREAERRRMMGDMVFVVDKNVATI